MEMPLNVQILKRVFHLSHKKHTGCVAVGCSSGFTSMWNTEDILQYFRKGERRADMHLS